MNVTEHETLQGLRSMYNSIDFDLIQGIYSETNKNIDETVNILNTIAGLPQGMNNKSNNFCSDFEQDYSRHSNYGDDTHSIADTNSVTDPDLQFAMMLQKEELEKEQKLRLQQEQDERFAFTLNQENGSQGNNIIEMNKENQNDINTNSEDPYLVLLANLSKKTKGNKEEITPMVIEEEDKSCVVCMDNDRNAIFVPCAHRCCCVKCANDIVNIKKFCPLCWMNLEGMIESQTTDR